ncbi:unnamed protein product [Polarella glacialis]|uniref:Uncharacterized protein n=2 Tax=Polarella glacialis TaxID=89957 RepID=A0A813M2V9_POLGL|nr:unnamed protein product [Polarella glacialis]
MVWEAVPIPQPARSTAVALPMPPPARLLLLWSGGGASSAELHMGRIHVPVAAPKTVRKPQLERARLKAGQSGAGGDSHFLLCQSYDAKHVAALVLQEPELRTGSSAVARVCLVDISDLRFSPTGGFGASSESSRPTALALEDLPEESVRMSAPLPDSYIWASAMRVSGQRGVCSVYAWRTRRLVTLDMQGDEENEDDDAGE